jgi:hypothetical protein
MKKRLIFLSALVALATVLPAVGASAHGAVVIPFQKSVIAGPDPVVWSGDAGDGSINTVLNGIDVTETGNVWHVAFDTWTVAGSGTACNSFSADLAGIVNLGNGRVAMNGIVTDGDCAGARIHVQAWLDTTTFSSQGTMRITP